MKEPIHYRRCHVCGSVNMKDGDPVDRCSHCNKSLAPFFYFNDRFKVVLGDETLRPPMMEGEYSPIQGLTAYWESF